MITVMICDDINEICAHFQKIINAEEDMEVVCTAHDKKTSVELAKKHCPDIILMDIQMDTTNAGIEATKEITEKLPNTKVIMLTIHNSADLVVEAYMNNAVDYILKDSDAETILSAIRSTYNSDTYLGSIITDAVKSHIKASKNQLQSLLYMVNNLSTLTPTEMIIVKKLCMKKKRSEIAKTEYISENTLKVHIKHILRKLEFSSTREMVIYLNSINVLQYLERDPD